MKNISCASNMQSSFIDFNLDTHGGEMVLELKKLFINNDDLSPSNFDDSSNFNTLRHLMI